MVSEAKRYGVATRRSSYPSGHWIDDFGNPVPSPNRQHYDPAPPPATLAAQAPAEPKADNWKIVKAKEVGNFLILQMNYPDCKNYEGNKILVFQGVTMIDLVNQRLIDPHFFKDSKYKSPIARFEPTNQGWLMAEVFVNAWRSTTQNR